MLSMNFLASRLYSLTSPSLQVREQDRLQLQNKVSSSLQPVSESKNISSVAAAELVAKNFSRWFDSDRLIHAAEADPAYAAQMAETFAYVPDKMTQNWADAPSPADADAFNAWANQSVQFDKEAEPINAQRIALYNSLKAEGKSGVDILKSIINFNGSQPKEYQIKTGFWKLDVTA